MVYESRRGEMFLLGASHVAHRGHHARPRGRHARARASRARCRSGTATARAARSSSAARSARSPASSRGATPADALARLRDDVRPRRARGASNLRAVPRRAARGRPAPSPTTARSSSSASATSSATGGCASSRRSARGCTRRGRWRSRRRLRRALGPGAQVLWSDDGIVLRLPEAVDDASRSTTCCSTPTRSRRWSSRALPGTALFASVVPRGRGPRAAAAPPPARPAHAAVAAAPAGGRPAGRGRASTRRSRSCSRPRASACTTCSTCRRCARCWPTSARARRSVVAVDTERASPFAQSLLFGWIAVYMYEGDAPLAERRAAALALDRDLLRELLGAEELRELLDPAALAELELELQRLADGRRARDADDVHDLLRQLGDLTDDEIAARTDGDPAGVARAGARATAARSACASPGEERLAAVEDAARLRDALGVVAPARACPACSPSPSTAPLETSGRPLRPHPRAVPRRPTSPARLGVGADRVARRARRARGRRARRARRVPARRRRARVVRRRRAAPAPPALARRAAQGGRAGRRRRRSAGSCPRGRASTAPRRGPTRWSRRSRGCRAPRSPPRSSSPTSCRSRVRGYRPPTSTRCARRRPRLGRRRRARRRRRPGRAVLPRPGAAARAAAARGRRPTGELHDGDPRPPRAHAARRSGPICVAGGRHRRRAHRARARSGTWSGRARSRTTRSRRCGRSSAQRPRAKPPRAGLDGRGPARSGAPGRPPAPGAGRSSRRCSSPTPTPTEAAHARALQLLERHGVLTREAVLAEGVAGGFAGVYACSRRWRSRARSGAATSSPGSARRSSRSPAPSTGSGPCASRSEASSATAVLAGGDRPGPAVRRRAAVARGTRVGPRGPPARSSCWSTARSPAFLERGARSLLTFGVDAARVGRRARLAGQGRAPAQDRAHAGSTASRPRDSADRRRACARPGSPTATAASRSGAEDVVPEGDTIHRAAAMLRAAIDGAVVTGFEAPRARGSAAARARRPGRARGGPRQAPADPLRGRHAPCTPTCA